MKILPLSKRHGTAPRDWLLTEVEDLDKRQQRRHELWILSCYVDLKAVRSLIRDLSERVRLVEVYLAFDYSEVYRYGPRKLNRELGALKQSCTKQEIEFEVRFLAAPSGLVHAKGFAVVQRVGEEVVDGILLLGSANLTAPGFVDGRNVELGALTRQVKQLRSFEQTFSALWDDLGTEKIDDAVLAREPDLFRFALLSSGVFLHKWDGNLRQLVGIRYRLVNEDKWAQLPDDLKVEGFELSKTLTRHVLKLDDLPKRSLPGEFIRNFTIDTSLGRWCPADAWAAVAGPESKAYWEAFKAATADDVLERLVNEAAVRQEQLVRDGLIAPVDSDHLENWLRRIRVLRDSPERLARLHTGYEEFSMPFDAQSRKEIDDLFESLKLSLETRSHANWVTRALDESIKLKNLDPLGLDEEASALLAGKV